MRKINSFHKTNLFIASVCFGVTSLYVRYLKKNKQKETKEIVNQGFTFPELEYMKDPPKKIPKLENN